MTPKVYPGATSTRFSHSLGVLPLRTYSMWVLDQRHDPHGVQDLFGEWELGADIPMTPGLATVPSVPVRSPSA
jgi:hypothetical protein